MFIFFLNNKIQSCEVYQYGLRLFNILKKIYKEFFNKINFCENLIEVSFGEIIDKYSILELKNKYINDPNKLNEIQKEIKILNQKIGDATKTFFYKLLLHINEQIWIDTDNIKQLDILNNNSNKDLYIELSSIIFENNQKRFRLKNYFNILQNSNIKECKSYSDNKCFIIINHENEINDKIPEINYLCISYDTVYFKNNHYKIISNLFKNPNIIFINDDNFDIQKKYNLSTYKIKTEIRDIFNF